MRFIAPFDHGPNGKPGRSVYGQGAPILEHARVLVDTLHEVVAYFDVHSGTRTDTTTITARATQRREHGTDRPTSVTG